MSPSIVAFPHKYVSGWPAHDDARAVLAPAGVVLAGHYSTDAHFAAYGADLARRHTVALFKNPAHADRIATVNLRMELAVFDIDGPDHVCTDAWWASETTKINALDREHPDSFAYRTRGGYRLIFALPKPFPLRSQADDDAWTARYKSWIKYLARRFAIAADEACADWTHFYRAPFVVRDGAREERETIGNPHELGPWVPTLEREDRVRVTKTPNYGVVEPVPLGELDGKYAFARVEAAVHYLQNEAPLGIEGQHGRTTFFRVCCVLIRRLRLPIDVAADAVEAIYNPQLAAIPTTTWTRAEIVNRLESARDTATEVPWGDVPDEQTWNAMNGIRRKTAS